MVGGCLREKNTKRCMVVLGRCLAVFLVLCYFLLLFLLFVTFVSYFLLLKGVKFVTFFTACNFQQLLFTVEKGQGLYSIHCARGELERVHLDFFSFSFFLLLRGRGVEVNVFFPP